jgi:predicted nucleotidyltransferase
MTTKGIPRIPIQKEQIAAFCKSNYIKDLALFGSVLTDRFSDDSDVDVLVEFDPAHIPGFFGLVDMEDQFAEIVGRKADIHTPRDLSPYFRDEVIKQAYTLYGKGQFHTS